jgi:hypothetical protein
MHPETCSRYFLRYFQITTQTRTRLDLSQKGIYKNDEKFGPGVLTYRDDNKSEDVGYWIADKLVRLLVKFDIDFQQPATEPIDRLVTIPSWYDREFLLDETLNPQNLFTKKLYPEKSMHFLRFNPNVDKVLQDKIELVDNFLKICADPDTDFSIFRESKTIAVPNASPKFVEIFKWKERFSYFQAFSNNVLFFPVDKFDQSTDLVFRQIRLTDFRCLLA